MKRLLPLLLLITSSAVHAESGAYRVEVIVFRNLLEVAETTQVQELRSFSRYPDTEEINIPEAPIKKPAESINEQFAGDLVEILPNDLPDDLHIITRKSSRMDGVWRRLRSSKSYRPLVYAAWQQNRTDYYPAMRVHDSNIIDSQLRPPTNILIADLAAQDPLADYRSTFYLIDGSVQLRRSRFLHLFLDLEYRAESLQSLSEADFFGNNQFQPEPGLENAPEHGVFTLKQNRQIRTGQMQYFDTPYFGALVLVSAVAPTDDNR